MMFAKLADATGSGWKGYLAGIGLLLLAAVQGIDVLLQMTGGDLLPEVTTFDVVVQTLLLGLGVFGIRHRLG